MRNLSLLVPFAALLFACTPTVQLEAPDKPIEINLNVKIEQHIKVELKAAETELKNADKTIEDWRNKTGSESPRIDKTGLVAIMAAADYFHEKTGRQVTYEYVLLRGLNDDIAQAREMAALLAGRGHHDGGAHRE